MARSIELKLIDMSETIMKIRYNELQTCEFNLHFELAKRYSDRDGFT